MITSVELWWYKGQTLPLSVLVEARDGLEEVLAEALAETRRTWAHPESAVPLVAAKLGEVFPGVRFFTTSMRNHYTLVVDFINRRVTDVDDDFRSKGFKKWLRQYDL